MPDANTVAIGAIQNDAINGSQFANESGHVRIFDLSSTLNNTQTAFNQNDIMFYPNPTKTVSVLTLNESIALHNLTIKLLNLQGQILWQKANLVNHTCEINMNATTGVYFLEIAGNGKKSVLKIVKE
jgi:hypothetical protein